MHVPTDVPVVTLVVSVLVLFVSTALLSQTIPGLRWPRRRRRLRRSNRDSGRRVITGRPPALPAGPLPVPTVRPRSPGRQTEPAPNVPVRADGLSEAEATIEHLLETDPDFVARLMMHWIRTDGPRARTGS